MSFRIATSVFKPSNKKVAPVVPTKGKGASRGRLSDLNVEPLRAVQTAKKPNQAPIIFSAYKYTSEASDVFASFSPGAFICSYAYA